MKLSAHFTLEELTASTKAKALKIDNTPNVEHKKNLETLAIKCLEPIRELLGKPMIISSGYRCSALNKAVGGSSTSHHTQGFAVDFVVNGMTNEQIVKKIKESNVQFTQLIEETSGKSKWTHISYVPTNLKKEVLIYKNGKYSKHQ